MLKQYHLEKTKATGVAQEQGSIDPLPKYKKN
jgi:hypothetical protein